MVKDDEHTVELFKWFVDNYSTLSESYSGRAVLIKEFKVLKDFDDEFLAAVYADQNLDDDNYIIQNIVEGASSYTPHVVNSILN